MAFRPLPGQGRTTLANLRVPASLLGRTGDLVSHDITIAEGRIAEGAPGETVDMGGAMVFPCFIDMHTHLDKGHIWPRAPNPDGTFGSAIAAGAADRCNWSVADLRTRMDFSLRSAFAHGTRAIRTHLDSSPGHDGAAWSVFAEMRERWAGRIALQAASLAASDSFDDMGDYAATADIVAGTGGVLGLLPVPGPDLPSRLRAFLDLAGNRGLAVDFHADETLDPASEALRAVAEAILDTGFDRNVVVGHCCSLAAQDEARALDTLDLVARAGLHIVSLPLCNLYLQDRAAGRTPRMRGVTLVHEMRARGIPVAFASDNTRDPFYAHGDLDMIEVMREATRIAHLDHAGHDWPLAFTATPAAACEFDAPSFAPGAPADLVIVNARSWTEFFSRPQSDRMVLRAGRAIDTTPPDYAELDHLMETP